MLFLLLLMNVLISCQSFTVSSNIAQKENTLLFVHAIFRPGERTPLIIFPNDENKTNLWPEGVGKLTRLGKKHHYALGKFLRSMYKDFLTSNPEEVFVNSSILDRCLQGAAITVAGLFEPEGIWKFEDNLNWQPIPVHYLPKDQDKYLNFEYPCLRVDAELTMIRYSEEVLELYQEHQAKLEELSNYIGINLFQDLNIEYVQDALLIQKMYNLVPDWIAAYTDEFAEILNAIFEPFLSSPITQRLRIGPLLQKLSQNMEKKINGDISGLKLQLYSVQDATVRGILIALNIPNLPPIPYCSTLLIELHEMLDATKTVRLLYLNSTDPTSMGTPHVLVLDDCSEFCPLENFTKKFQHLIPDDFEEECQLGEPDTDVFVTVLVPFVISVTLFALCYYVYGKRRYKTREKVYSVTKDSFSVSSTT